MVWFGHVERRDERDALGRVRLVEVPGRPPLLQPRCQGRVMGFVGGGGNIAIATALPPSLFVHCIVNIT